MEKETPRKKIYRRDLLKRSLKTAGYVVPAMVFLSMGSLDGWARNYHRRGPGPGPRPLPGQGRRRRPKGRGRRR